MSESAQQAVQSKYASLAQNGLSTDHSGVQAVAQAFGYTPEQLASIPAEANMGVSCGNPTAFANLKPGETVVDLGCGGGLDVFLAARKVGPTGTAIGIDMTPEMLHPTTTCLLGCNTERRETMLDVQHISIFIDHPPSDVYDFAADPHNLPRWAAGRARSDVHQKGDEWIADTPFGRVRIRFLELNSLADSGQTPATRDGGDIRCYLRAGEEVFQTYETKSKHLSS